MTSSRHFAVVIAALSMNGCSNIGYYAQSVRGQLDLLWKREPINDVVQRAETPAELKDKLTRVLAMRDFATQILKLPDNGSYRSYADLRREHVVWTVFATPEFSLDLRQWCFPFAGCVSYRGHFSPEAAEEFAAPLRAAGDDVYTGGIDAYSTLGWFDDPVLNTFIRRTDPYLAGLIFHELAHQQLYVKNDSTFNESFARTVELAGVRRWIKANGTPEQLDRYQVQEARREEFVALIEASRAQLAALYAASTPTDEKRVRKQQLYDHLRENYTALKKSWNHYAGYDAWFDAQLNNARLASLTTYTDFVPAFEALLRQNNNDFVAYYAAAKVIGELPAEERKRRLEQLALHANY